MTGQEFLIFYLIAVLPVSLGVGQVMRAKGYGWDWYLAALVFPWMAVVMAVAMPMHEREAARRQMVIREMVDSDGTPGQ